MTLKGRDSTTQEAEKSGIWPTQYLLKAQEYLGKVLDAIPDVTVSQHGMPSCGPTDVPASSPAPRTMSPKRSFESLCFL